MRLAEPMGWYFGSPPLKFPDDCLQMLHIEMARTMAEEECLPASLAPGYVRYSGIF
jgi:hypothetical protein